ncbi:MAG TPA: helix-turn-helix transcriptional regulator [Candidatus Aphodovivens avicola]|nr:helix-turn-helix transcriptional regulator [Candidatus Aphodovivens avicola]
MIFADKLILLRKKAGWSQEELAEQMDITRQSVSKWEGAQSVPDLEKMIRLSELFGVSTDYLLKDEIEEAEQLNSSNDIPTLRRVSMEEANAFLSIKSKTAKTIAYATFLCILSPIALLMLGAINESTPGILNEDIAGGIGMIVLIIFAAISAVMFVLSGNKTAPFAYLEKEKFETEYGVRGMVKERKAQYKDLHTKNNIAGTCLCITALIPLFVGAIIDADNDLFLTIMLSLSFLIAGVGVICFIKTGIIWESYEKLLQEGEYSIENKEKPSIATAVYTAYWIIATAIYLGYSLSSNNWGQSWIIWVVAGVMFPAIIAITNAFDRKSK